MKTAAALMLCLACVPAHAARQPYPVTQFDGDRYSARVAQGGTNARDMTRTLRAKRTHQRAGKRWRGPVPVPRPRPGVVDRITATIIGGRPSGCPHRFCGCALSIHIFGRIIPTLNLAANWGAFPRAAPSGGMVAVRRGHVFKLLAHVGGSTWKVWDANSGRGRIRIHNRSIAGHTIVNPHGGRRA